MPSAADALAFADLCAHVLPVWGRQLLSSRQQSEGAVAEMLAAFAELGPHLDMATRQSRQVSAALTQADGITQLAQACRQELQPVMGHLDPVAQQAVQRVLEMIGGTVLALEHITKPFVYETEKVSQQVERMYKGFQYQDRISQMIGLLHDDIERLREALVHPPSRLQASAWLQRLESNYVMSEQRKHHHGAASASAGDEEDTTFF
jgi:hypothetical protein